MSSQHVNGDLPEPRDRVGVERVRGDAAPGARLVRAGAAAGMLRSDIEPGDVMTTLSGVFMATVDAAQRDRAGRVLDLIMDGLRYRAAD